MLLITCTCSMQLLCGICRISSSLHSMHIPSTGMLTDKNITAHKRSLVNWQMLVKHQA